MQSLLPFKPPPGLTSNHPTQANYEPPLPNILLVLLRNDQHLTAQSLSGRDVAIHLCPQTHQHNVLSSLHKPSKHSRTQTCKHKHHRSKNKYNHTNNKELLLYITNQTIQPQRTHKKHQAKTTNETRNAKKDGKHIDICSKPMITATSNCHKRILYQSELPETYQNQLTCLLTSSAI